MLKVFGSKDYHFKEGENRPNIEKILKTLNENGLLEFNFNFSEWRSNTNEIIQQLKKYNSELVNDKYLDKPIEFIFELKSKLSEKIETSHIENILENLAHNGVADENKKIKKIFRYNSIYEVLNKILSDAIYKNIHLSDANLEITSESNILDLYRKIYDLYRKIERLNEYFNNREYEKYLGNRDRFLEEFDKINNSKNIVDKLEILQNIINQNNENIKNGNVYRENFFYEIYRILDLKNRHSNTLKNLNLNDEFHKYVKIINDGLELINDENIQNILNSLETNTEIKFNLHLSEFIPAFIARIDIIEIPEANKNKLIEAFEKRKSKKDYLSLGYLVLSILIFLAILLINYRIYLDNIGNTKTISDFIINFLGHNIYLFSIEILLLIIAFYLLGLFKTYSKIVELYDSHILIIESDFYYRNDKDLSNSGMHTFELRKENTQKIHSLPDKAFEMLNGKHEIKTELPISKILDKIGEILEKVLPGSDKK